MVLIVGRRRWRPGRRRTGQAGIIIVILIFAGLFIILAETGAYEGIVRDQLRGQVEDLFQENVVVEDVLSAPCATRSRGVFYRSSVLSGDFACLSPPDAIYLNFTMGSTQVSWAVSKTDDDVTVQPVGPDPIFTQTMTVHVYDEDTGTVETALLAVGGQ